MLKKRIFLGVVYLILIFICILYLIPFIWMVSSSLKGPDEVFKFPPTIIPTKIRWDNYIEIFKQLPFGLFMKNSFIICVFAVFGQIFTSSFTAFGFARLNFRGRDILFLMMIATMMIPTEVTYIPLFIMFRKIGWLDSFLPIIVPSMMPHAFNVFLIRQFYLSIPYELDEASAIDGCNKFNVYRKIILPLSHGPLIVVGLFTFFSKWREFMGPLIYLDSMEKRTVALGICYFMSPYHCDWQLLMAACTVSLIPVLILFFCGQKYLLKSIVTTGLKG